MRISYHGPQAPAHAVTQIFRGWYRRRGEDDTRLLVSSFILLDPWTTIDVAAVPYWTFFAVQPALDGLRDHLAKTGTYREAHLVLFEHGADSRHRSAREMASGIARSRLSCRLPRLGPTAVPA